MARVSRWCTFGRRNGATGVTLGALRSCACTYWGPQSAGILLFGKPLGLPLGQSLG